MLIDGGHFRMSDLSALLSLPLCCASVDVVFVFAASKTWLLAQLKTAAEHLEELTGLVTEHIVRMCQHVGDEEVERAKTQVQPEYARCRAFSQKQEIHFEVRRRSFRACVFVVEKVHAGRPQVVPRRDAILRICQHPPNTGVGDPHTNKCKCLVGSLLASSCCVSPPLTVVLRRFYLGVRHAT